MSWSKIASTKYVGGADGGTTSGVDTTGANVIAVYVNWLSSGSEPVLSDSVGGHSNTYVPGALRAEVYLSSRLYRCVNPQHTGSGHSWSLTGTGNFPGAFVLALQGNAAGSVVFDADKESGAAHPNGFGFTTIQPGALTPSANNAVMVAGLGEIATGAISVDSSFATAESNVDVPGTNFGGAIAWKTVATPASVNPAYSWSANLLDDSTASMMVFLEGITFSWAADDMAAGEIVPVDNGQTYATILHGGTYDVSGTTPVTIERQLYAVDGTTVLQSWTALSGTSISGGSWSGSIQTAGGDGFRFKFRAKDSGGSVIATSGISANHWGVGDVGAQVGQSHLPLMESDVSSPPVANAAGRTFDGTSWGAPAGNGNIAMLNALVAGRAGQGLGGTDWPFGIVLTGVAGAGVTYNDGDGKWLDTGSGSPFAFFKTKVGAVRGGKVNWILDCGGSTDAAFGHVDYTTLYAGTQTMRANINSWIGLSSSALPWFIMVNGCANDGVTADQYWDVCRQVDLIFARDETNVHVAALLADLPLADEYHLTAAGYGRAGKRVAQSILKFSGAVSNYDGADVSVASAVRVYGSTDILVTPAIPGATALKETDGTTDGGSLTGWQASSDNFSGLLTISSTAFVGAQIKLTLSAAPADSDAVKVRYLYGTNPSITNPVYDNAAPGGDTLGRPLLPTIGAVTVGISFSDVIVESSAAADVTSSILSAVAAAPESDAFAASANAVFAGLVALSEVASASDATSVSVPGSSFSVAVAESGGLSASANGLIPGDFIIDPKFLIKARPRQRTIVPGR